MILSMLLAHLVGDFILQWDRLAQWKSHRIEGVLVHGLIIFVVTWLFALPFAPGWWEGIIFIGTGHLLIDLAQWLHILRVPPLLRFLIDQALHLLVIVMALSAGGFIDYAGLRTQLDAILHNEYLLLVVLGYVFLTMPTWVLLKFLAYALLYRSGPIFARGHGKYLGILERLLAVTLVLTGMFVLLPLLALPSLVWERPLQMDGQFKPVAIFEFLAGITLAALVGIGLRLV